MPEIDSAAVEVVAKVEADEVEIYRLPLIERKFHGVLVSDASVRVSCGAVELESVSVQRGLVVPIPTIGFVTPFG